MRARHARACRRYMPVVCCAPVLCAHVLQTIPDIPDCLRVMYLRACMRGVVRAHVASRCLQSAERP